LEFEKRLVRYALAGSAVLCLPAASHASSFDYFLVNQPVTTSNSPYTFSFDGSQADFTLSLENNDFFYEYIYGNGVYVTPQNAAAFVGSGGYPSALSVGASIYPGSSTFTNENGELSGFLKYGPEEGFKGNWSPSGSPAYLGVQFYISGDPDPHSGWVQISTTVTNGTESAEIIDYAYNTVGYDGSNSQASSISAGEESLATPEPSSLALYAVGAAGILALRRRRKLAA
jgi:hypothetical protein